MYFEILKGTKIVVGIGVVLRDSFCCLLDACKLEHCIEQATTQYLNQLSSRVLTDRTLYGLALITILCHEWGDLAKIFTVLVRYRIRLTNNKNRYSH